MMKFPTLLLSLAGTLAPSLSAAPIQSNFWYQSTISSDTNGPLDLLAELNYDNARPNAPIAVVMHGYSPSASNVGTIRANAQRLRDNGFFAISVAMRNRDGSDGVRDSGGLEIHDIYDAVEAVKASPAFTTLIDPTNVHITGYSGGGGNTMAALTKFPDYFRLGASFYGMSDYGYDPVNCWYNKGASSSHQSIMNNDVGNPNTGGNPVLDRYLARASNRASKNNPYSEIHLFVNSNEGTCPPINNTSYRDNAIAAESSAGEFDNITVHIGGSGYEDFNNNSINDPNELQSWPHGYPTASQQDAGELWYRDRLLAGTIPQPVLNDSDELQVAGFVKTAKFDCWLGDGQNAAGTLTYSLSDTLMSFSLSLLSSDLTVTGDMSIDTARMAGRSVLVELDNTPVETFSGGGTYDYSGLGHGQTLELIDNGPDTNAPPTLSALAGTVETTIENTEVEITFTELAAQGDEADGDGTVEAFVVQAVSSGSLRIGTTSGSATAFAPGVNDVIDAGANAYWTPALGATGAALNAFTVVVRDDDFALSSPPVQAAIKVTAGTSNAAPTLTAFAGTVETTLENTEVEITFAELAAQGDEADGDGTVQAFVVQAVSSGSLWIGATSESATAFAPGTNDVIDAGANAYWTPALGATGLALDAFTVVARDDDSAESSPAVQVTVGVTIPGVVLARVQTTTNVSGTLVQDGWTVIDGSRDLGPISSVVGGVTVSLSNSYGRSSADGRPVVNLTDGDLDNLLS